MLLSGDTLENTIEGLNRLLSELSPEDPTRKTIQDLQETYCEELRLVRLEEAKLTYRAALRREYAEYHGLGLNRQHLAY